jgi:hypothetical protein
LIPRFRNFILKLAPRWLTEGEGGLVLESLGITLDAQMERIRLGLTARFPEYTPSDGFAPMGRDRRIVRGINESEASYAARLITWLDDWRTAGNPYALMRQLRGYCNVDMRIRTVDNRGNWYTRESDGSQSFNLAQGNWDWDSETNASAADQWSRFWVILYPPSSLWEPAPRWGEAGAVYGSGRTWGTTATGEQVRSVRSLIKDWKPAGTRCVNIIIAFDDASFAPTDPAGDPLPNGWWGHWSRNVGGVQVPTRLSTARYWKGTS